MVAFDLLVLVLQLVMLGVTVEKRRLDAPDGETGGRGEGGAEEGQDHDAEERGWRRSQEDREGIELQSLGVTSGGRSGGEEDGERNESSNGIEGAANAHPGDAFYSGQYVVASVRIIDNIRAQWREGQPAATGSAESSSMRTAAAAELARRRLRFRIRIGGRDYGL